ncbi:MAG: tryptophan-rich sensory protein [Lachnospiraceae bacterium]|nr:tryptophan-rich sensory protein [Lachnospiraceae bacterium]
MNIKKDELSIAVLLPVAVGTVAAYLTRNAQVSFSMMNQPPLSPPAWLFPVVWTILYVLMGIASYIIWRSDNKDARNALQVYLIQLGFNFCWPIIFFNFKWYLFAFFWLVALWVLILITTIKFYRISKSAAYLMIPYILWVSFAGYLNIGVYFLN